METLKQFIESQTNDKIRSRSFIEYVNFIMNNKDLKASDVYNSVDIDRRTWSKIISNKINPSLEVAVKIAIGLKLSNEECKIMLKKLNYTLSRSSEFSLIIRYCLENKIYDLIKINEMLYSKGQKNL